MKFLDGLLLLCTVLWSILFLQLQLCSLTFCVILSSCSRHNFSGDENPSGNSLSVTKIVEIFKLFISLRHHLQNLCSLFFPQYSINSSFLSIPLREFHVVDVKFSAYKPGDELQGNQLSVLLTKDGTLSIPGGYSRQVTAFNSTNCYFFVLMRTCLF